MIICQRISVLESKDDNRFLNAVSKDKELLCRSYEVFEKNWDIGFE